jgi:uncharacterized integral membrane protein
MADPHHIPELDGFDRMTVRLYRLGLWIAALALVVAAGVRLAEVAVPFETLIVVQAGVALAVANMHLYAKNIRWFIAASCSLGLVLQLGAAALPAWAAGWVLWAGVGFVFISLSAFALKEQFCFRIPGLKAVPLFLAASLVPLVFDHAFMAGGLLLPAGLVLTVLAWQKSRMPLHFDVGNKSQYQV